jgi:hypothetical protein
MDTYSTTSIAEASYLITLGHEPLEVLTSQYTSLKTFIFDGACRELVGGYYRDELVPARTYQSSFQAVRRLIRA